METNGCRDYPLPPPSNCRQPVTVEDTISANKVRNVLCGFNGEQGADVVMIIRVKLW